jgi:hypothetical protein
VPLLHLDDQLAFAVDFYIIGAENIVSWPFFAASAAAAAAAGTAAAAAGAAAAGKWRRLLAEEQQPQQSKIHVPAPEIDW